jgi:hypothetical protein
MDFLFFFHPIVRPADQVYKALTVLGGYVSNFIYFIYLFKLKMGFYPVAVILQ